MDFLIDSSIASGAWIYPKRFQKRAVPPRTASRRPPRSPPPDRVFPSVCDFLLLSPCSLLPENSTGRPPRPGEVPVLRRKRLKRHLSFRPIPRQWAGFCAQICVLSTEFGCRRVKATLASFIGGKNTFSSAKEFQTRAVRRRVFLPAGTELGGLHERAERTSRLLRLWLSPAQPPPTRGLGRGRL